MAETTREGDVRQDEDARLREEDVLREGAMLDDRVADLGEVRAREEFPPLKRRRDTDPPAAA